MAEGTLVEALAENGRVLIQHLARHDVPITAACWVKANPEQEQGEKKWLFFLVSGLVDEQGPGAAYNRLYSALVNMPSWFRVEALSQINVVGVHSPIAQAVDKILTRYPGRPKSMVYVGPCRLGSIEAEEVHIYPPAVWEIFKPNWFDVRLKGPVEVNEPPSSKEKQAMDAIMTSGLTTNTAQAGAFVWNLYHNKPRAEPIPAGTVVKAMLFLGEPNEVNSLLWVRAPDGREGITAKDNTETLAKNDPKPN